MITVDVGNTFAKFGYFSRQSLRSKFPKPESSIRILPDKKNTANNSNLFNDSDHKLITNWLGDLCEVDDWYISVTASCCVVDSLISELKLFKPDGRFRILTNADVPIESDVDFPARTGIDRLFDAFAAAKFVEDFVANSVEDSNGTSDQRIIETIIVVDAGTAITIDAVRTNVNPAVFEGGVILSGLRALSVVLSRAACRLPAVEFSKFSSTDLIYPAKNTESAILTGMFGGLIAAINFFAQKIKTKKNNADNSHKKIPIIFTGGDAAILGKLFAGEFDKCSEYSLSIIPDLTLIGIAIVVSSDQFESKKSCNYSVVPVDYSSTEN
ncbi:MAG: type III pantothenate kinase [Planctomycetaceae bacterium]|jgi:pantothenate kinase type III|nr:type III pantothenate kinase [Planctomycetaceae bacterium]